MAKLPPRNLELEAKALANLGDMDSWRVYADWLQSMGDPRGELASLYLHRRDAFRSQRATLAEAINERERPYVDRWHQWAQTRDLLDVRPRFERGFVVELEGPLPQLYGTLDELFERDPIQRLTLRDVEDDLLMSLCEQHPPWFARLHYLRVTGRVGALGAAGLAEVSLTKLARLNLLGNHVDAEACAHLARLDTGCLRALTLTANQIDAAGLELLLESPTRGQWRELYLAGNPLETEGLEHLAKTTQLEQLEALYLCDTETVFAKLAILLDSANLSGLKKLEVSSYGSWGAKKLRMRMRERWGDGLVLR